MRRLFNFLIPLAIISCSNQVNRDTESVSQTDTTLQKSQTPTGPITPLNVYKNRNDFSISYGNLQIDTIIASYSKNPKVKTTLKKDICTGNICMSYKTLANPSTGITLYLFKGENGDYGFYNKQYIMRHDTIAIVRELDVSIESWPKDSTPVWSCEETVFYFEKTQTRSSHRKVTTRNLENFDLTFKNEGLEFEFFFETPIYNRKLKAFKELLETKSDVKKKP